MKKNHSIVKLVLSLLSLMVGIVWTGALIIVTFSGGAPIWRLLILLVFTVLFLFLGIRGLLDWKKTSLAEGTKIPRAVPIVLGVVGVLLVIQMALYFPIAARNGRMTRFLKPYVQEDYTDENVKLPENPRFVFYHNGSFTVPSKRFIFGTDDPSHFGHFLGALRHFADALIVVHHVGDRRRDDSQHQNVPYHRHKRPPPINI